MTWSEAAPYVAALISFLAAIYAAWQGQRLKRLEGDQAKDVKRLEAELQRRGFVHTKQFERESEAYSRIWESVVKAQHAFAWLTPRFERPSEPVDEDSYQKLKELFGALVEVKKVYERERPFLGEKVHAIAGVFYLTTLTAIKDQLKSDRSSLDETKAKLEKVREEMNSQSEELCAAIRERLFPSEEE